MRSSAAATAAAASAAQPQDAPPPATSPAPPLRRPAAPPPRAPGAGPPPGSKFAVQPLESVVPAPLDWSAWADAVSESPLGRGLPASAQAARRVADALTAFDARVASAVATSSANAGKSCFAGAAAAQMQAIAAAQGALKAQAHAVLRSGLGAGAAAGLAAAAAAQAAQAKQAAQIGSGAQLTAAPAAADGPFAYPPPRAAAAGAAKAASDGCGDAALGGARFLAGCSSGELRVWRGDGRERTLLAVDGTHNGPVLCLVPLPHGRAASGGEDGMLRLWRVSDGACERANAAHANGVTAMAFLPPGGDPSAAARAPPGLGAGGGLLATGGADGMLRLWRLSDGASHALHVPNEDGSAGAAPFAHGGGVSALVALTPPCAFVLASTGCDGTVRVFRAGRPAPGAAPDAAASMPPVHAQCMHRAHATAATALAALPSGRVASAAKDGGVILWSSHGDADLVVPPPRWQKEGRAAGVHALVAISGDRLGLACADWTVRILDTTDGTLLTTLAGHSLGVTAAAALSVHGGGDVIASSGPDGTLCLWAPAAGASTARAGEAPPLLRRRVMVVPPEAGVITVMAPLPVEAGMHLEGLVEEEDEEE
jgi:hypothetical protein